MSLRPAATHPLSGGAAGVALGLALLFVGGAGGCSRAREPASGGNAPHTTPSESPPPPSTAVTEPPPAAPCLERISIERGTSVLAEHRNTGARVDDFASHYRAAYLDPEVNTPVAAVARFQIGKTPLLWYSEDRGELIVNAAVLSDLQVAEAVNMSTGERKQLGALTELGQGKIDGRELLLFLLHARVIGTFVHLGAELCVVSEAREGGAYRASVRGEHTFFTSKENRKPVAFEFTMGADGSLEVAIP